MKEKNHLDTDISNSTNEDLKAKSMKSRRENPKFDYCIGLGHEKYCFINKMDIMKKFLRRTILMFNFLQEEGSTSPPWSKKMVSACMLWVQGRNKFLIYLFHMSFYLFIYSLKYQNMKPLSLA